MDVWGQAVVACFPEINGQGIRVCGDALSCKVIANPREIALENLERIAVLPGGYGLGEIDQGDLPFPVEYIVG